VCSVSLRLGPASHLTVAAVRLPSVEREYLRPVLNNGRVVLEERPITTVRVFLVAAF